MSTKSKNPDILKLKYVPAEAQKFDANHGHGATDRFVRVLFDAGTLVAVSEEFAITRAYATMLFKRLFDMDFKDYKQRRKDFLYKKRIKSVK